MRPEKLNANGSHAGQPLQKTAYAPYYIQTMKKIVNGYRFPKEIKKEIYDVYADFAVIVTGKLYFNNYETVEEYLKLMPELNPDWKRKEIK